MRLLAALALVGALGAASGCPSAPPAPERTPKDVGDLHDEIDLLGAMAKRPGDRTPRQLAAVAACVTSAHRLLNAIAPERS